MLKQTTHHKNDRASGNIDAASGGDPLSSVLDMVRLRGAVFFQWLPSWPYAMGVPQSACFGDLIVPGSAGLLSYHIVVDGPCWACISDAAPVRLESGDILFLPHGDAYVIGNEPRAPCAGDEAPALQFFHMMAAGELPSVIEDGGGGDTRNRLICGFLGYDLRPFNPLLESMPRLLRIPAPQSDADPLASLIELALEESSRPAAGARCMLLRLSELMCIEVIRRHLNSISNEDTGWLAALGDPLVGRCLALLHQHFERPWTLGQLAGEIGSSRSILAQRFAELVGQPPMQYLANWRMQVAARKLENPNLKTFAIAQEVGYESEAAFNRAFKRLVGITPGQWRRRAQQDHFQAAGLRQSGQQFFHISSHDGH